MPIAERSDEHESTLRPLPGARPPPRDQWTAGARQPPTAFVTAAKGSNARMRENQFSSCKISLRSSSDSQPFVFLPLVSTKPRLYIESMAEIIDGAVSTEFSAQKLREGVCDMTMTAPMVLEGQKAFVYYNGPTDQLSGVSAGAVSSTPAQARTRLIAIPKRNFSSSARAPAKSNATVRLLKSALVP